MALLVGELYNAVDSHILTSVYGVDLYCLFFSSPDSTVMVAVIWMLSSHQYSNSIQP